MNVGDLVMVTLRRPGHGGEVKKRPGLILQIEPAVNKRPDATPHFLVLTGPRQMWVEQRQIRPFPAASMAQTRRVTDSLEKLVMDAKGCTADDE